MTKKTLLVTGASGFIGRHVAREFAAKGWNVVGIGRNNWTDWRDYGLTDWHRAEVDIDSLRKYAGQPDAIVHCAGGASVSFSVDNPGADFDLTVRTTSGVLEFIRVHSPATRLVYPSSPAVHGEVKHLPICENAPVNPKSPYGLHKQMSEALCQLYSRQFGISAAIVRLFSIYGLGLRKQLLWDACRKFQQRESEFFGTGDEIRDWLHVKDAARLLYAAAQNATNQCPIVNGGSGTGVLVRELLQHLSAEFGLGIEPIFSSMPKPGDPNAYIADASRAAEWNWHPTISWREGVAEYVDWYKRCQ